MCDLVLLSEGRWVLNMCLGPVRVWESDGQISRSAAEETWVDLCFHFPRGFAGRGSVSHSVWVCLSKRCSRNSKKMCSSMINYKLGLMCVSAQPSVLSSEVGTSSQPSLTLLDKTRSNWWRNGLKINARPAQCEVDMPLVLYALRQILQFYLYYKLYSCLYIL